MAEESTAVARAPEAGEATHPGLFAPREPDDLSTHAHRQAMGYLGLVLPPLLVLVTAWRSTDGVPGWSILDSVSAYYHSGSVSVLTGVLTALAVFLFTYRGYANDAHGLDRLLGMSASVAALGVSFFPTTANPPFTAPRWWAEWMRTVHYVSAAALFATFILYCLVLFPKKSPRRQVSSGKTWRNRTYYLCGAGMVVCVVWAALAGRAGQPIFWQETFALWLFGLSWLAKGRADWTLKRIVSREQPPVSTP
jgi:hypothetical protein